MAEKKITETTAQTNHSGPWERITIEPTPEGLESFVGTREDLIAAGICTEAQFPLPPRRILSYQCKLGDWITSKVKGGYRHQVQGREAMAKNQVMEAMKEETRKAVNEFARQLWIAITDVIPRAMAPKALVNDESFHMTQDSFEKLFWAARCLHSAALNIEISPNSPAFDVMPKKPSQKRPTLTVVR